MGRRRTVAALGMKRDVTVRSGRVTFGQFPYVPMRFLLRRPSVALPCGVAALRTAFLLAGALLIAALPAQAQQPANAFSEPFTPAGPSEQTGAQATPDTTSPWRYFPLHVGNVWEFVDKEADVVVRHRIVVDTAFSGHRYVHLKEEHFPRRSNGSFGVSRVYYSFLRYDTTDQRVRQNHPLAEYERVYRYTRCALNVSFGAIVDCAPEGSWAVGGGYDGILVFGGERPGEGADTLRTSVKTFVQLGVGVEYGLGSGIGLVYYAFEGDRWALRYAKIDGVEHGRALVAVASEQEALPAPALGIVSIWPQPVRGRATLRVSLPEAAQATVEVFDLVGRRVAVLLGGPQAAGMHEVSFDAGALPSGLYLVRLSAGGQVRTERLAVVR